MAGAERLAAAAIVGRPAATRKAAVTVATETAPEGLSEPPLRKKPGSSSIVTTLGAVAEKKLPPAKLSSGIDFSGWTKTSSPSSQRKPPTPALTLILKSGLRR